MDRKILFTGRGTSGSWAIRGVQLAAAIGVRAVPMVTAPDCARADVVIGVKRLPDDILRAIRPRPLVWDVVDAWPQPRGNDWNRVECMDWLASELDRIRPTAVIAATDAMRADVESFGYRCLWLPHHHRPGIASNQIRERIARVGYEGGIQYIEPMRNMIEAECRRIGAEFVVNPIRLADVDVVLAMRNSIGYAPRHWKSAVKLSNAHGSGTPWIGCNEGGYREIATGCEYWAEDAAGLRTALAWLKDRESREAVSDRFRKAAFSVDRAAAMLMEWLCALKL